ncbi:MAG: hypothetical protein ACTSVI_07005 [Promethearchaeota archaeon]
MITQEILTWPIIPREYLYPKSIEDFLANFEGILDLDIETGMELDFLIEGREASTKISPVLKLARLEDAKDLADICKKVYDNSYPYHEMEDEKVIKKLIKDPCHHFILFKVGEYSAGCFRCAIDYKEKKGYMGGFMLRKQFHGVVDVIKVIMGSYYWMWSTFKDDVVMWHCENRTAHAALQHMTALCGINTVAIFPNKDIFYGFVESDVMGLIFNEKTLNNYRTKKVPALIENALEPFLFADNLYKLGFFQLVSPHLELDQEKINNLKSKINRKASKDKHGYEHFCLTLQGTKSYFSFLHTPSVKNYEKVKYHVDSLEEFHVFILEVRKCMVEQDIRYCEIFTSAHEPEYQQLLFEFGFRARGYVPCWELDAKEQYYDDSLVFSYHEGEIEHIELLPQGRELFSMVGLKVA